MGPRLDLLVSPRLQSHECRCDCHRDSSTACPWISSKITDVSSVSVREGDRNRRRRDPSVHGVLDSPSRCVLDECSDRRRPSGEALSKMAKNGPCPGDPGKKL